MLVVAAPAAAGGEKPLNAFETLTLAPIDRRLIERTLLTADEIAWLDAYHERVAAELTPLVDAETRPWLAAATPPAWPRLRRPRGGRHQRQATARSRPRRERAPWGLLLLLLLMAVTAIRPTTLNVVVPALPEMANRLTSPDVATVQLTVSVYLLALAAGQLLTGPLSDRFGRRPVLLAGLTLTAAASVLAISCRHGRQPDRRRGCCKRSALRPASWSAAPSSAICSTATAPPP